MEINFKRAVTVNRVLNFVKCDIDNLLIDKSTYLAIDGSTSNTGIALVDYKLNLVGSGAFSRNKKEESPVRYKINFKKMLTQFLLNNKNIVGVFYEEPCIDNISAVKNLFMLRTVVEEIIIENEPRLDYIKYSEVNNTRWKKSFLGEEEKLKQTGEEQKLQVRRKLINISPVFSELTMDETDALGMCIAGINAIRNGEDLGKTKKVKEFTFEIGFTGGEESEDDLQWIIDDCYDGPKKLLDKQINFAELTGKEKNFNLEICRAIGEEDNIAIIKYTSKAFGNVAIRYRIGGIVSENDYIYAVAWRRSRK